MAREKTDTPAFWIIAGPNGSGKSSLYGSSANAIYGNTQIADLNRRFWIINPDLLARRIRSVENLDSGSANLEAVRRIETWLEVSIKAHQSVGVETVLSTDKYRRLVRAAKKRNFEIRLIYVVLRSPKLNVERVRLRVRKGGHPVPTEAIEKRWYRSLKQLPWFLQNADWALLFDNSDNLRPVGRKENGTVILDPIAPEALAKAVAATKRFRH